MGEKKALVFLNVIWEKVIMQQKQKPFAFGMPIITQPS
jgi:hypothetical protein